MNTLARQSNSKTFLKACTAAVLLVTCLTTQAAYIDVSNQSEMFKAETMQSIQAESHKVDVVAPSLEVFNQAVEYSQESIELRSEALASMHADLQQSKFSKPSLDMLSAAIGNNTYASQVDSMQAEHKAYTWEASEEIYPAIASLGTIDYEASDATSREATMIALNFAIQAMENARSNLSVNQRLIL